MENRRLAQVILNHVIVFCLIVIALFVMSHYIRNSLCGKWREAAGVFGKGEIYLPKVTRIK